MEAYSLLLHSKYVKDRPGFCALLRRLVEAEGLHLEVSGIGGHREHAERVGVAEAALPALDGNDGGAGLEDVESNGIAETKADTVVDIGLPLVGLDAAGLGVPEWVDTAVEVDLAGGLLVAGD